MPKFKELEEGKQIVVDFGHLNPKQQQFIDSTTRYTCYGGARGGGKSHVVRIKAGALALACDGIRILMVRCHYPELEENIINPMCSWLPKELYAYNGTNHSMTFRNGSYIKFGHYDNDAAESEYQGQQYDVIFIDEATQLTERAFNYLDSICRGVPSFPSDFKGNTKWSKTFKKRIYVTCNPGGVGHRWVFRLFVEPSLAKEHPEKYKAKYLPDENPDDYTYIPATVLDNADLMQSDPHYMDVLKKLPEDIRAGHLYGDWTALGGAYFSEFDPRWHCCPRWSLPKWWTRYRSLDYGLDMLSVKWVAVDTDGRMWVYRELDRPKLIAVDAAHAVIDNTPPDENIVITYVPPDLYSTLKDSGKSTAEIFMGEGLNIFKASNNRIQGHMLLKNLLRPVPVRDPDVLNHFPKMKEIQKEGKTPKLPMVVFFDDLEQITSDLRDIQHDEKEPNDCAKEPHELTHSVDSMRYMAIMRQFVPEKPMANVTFIDTSDLSQIYGSAREETEYEDYMTGGDIATTRNYIWQEM